MSIKRTEIGVAGVRAGGTLSFAALKRLAHAGHRIALTLLFAPLHLTFRTAKRLIRRVEAAIFKDVVLTTIGQYDPLLRSDFGHQLAFLPISLVLCRCACRPCMIGASRIAHDIRRQRPTHQVTPWLLSLAYGLSADCGHQGRP